MIRLEQYKDWGIGKTIGILGGGVNLPSDLRKMPDVNVLMGINQHTLILDLDFIVFLDKEMAEYVIDHPAKKITHHNNWEGRSDFVNSGIAPSFGFSGALGIWIADYMNFDHVYVCGIDQYENREDGREYWWQAKKSEPTHHHCSGNNKRWIEIRDNLKRPNRIKFMSGKLKELWK